MGCSLSASTNYRPHPPTLLFFSWIACLANDDERNGYIFPWALVPDSGSLGCCVASRGFPVLASSSYTCDCIPCTALSALRRLRCLASAFFSFFFVFSSLAYIALLDLSN
ncbi:hypothetical protein BJX64DRAFT_203696 [Aspergillus heterothallicus]